MDADSDESFLVHCQAEPKGVEFEGIPHASNKPSYLRKSQLSTIRLVYLSLVTVFAVWGAVDAGTQFLEWLRGPQSIQCHCGVTAAEGLAQGCVFDELELGWMRPDCVDRELTQEFARSGPGSEGAWYYETEINGKMTPVNISTLSTLVEPGRTVRFTYEQHIMHCIFEWRKQLRQRFLGTVMSFRRGMEDHIKHCGKMFMLGAGMNETRTKLVYPSHIYG